MAERHRHTRAHTREHFVRVALKRRATILDYWATKPPEHVRLELGFFADGQPYINGCFGRRCGICLAVRADLTRRNRTRENREWRSDWRDELP